MLAIAAVLVLAGCATKGGYNQPPPAAVQAAQEQTPEQDDRAMYLSLIHRMQDEGAYFASLAHIDAYRQRFSGSAELDLLQADALRNTDKPAEASTLYHALTKGPQAGPAWHGLGLIAAAQGQYAESATLLGKAVAMDPLNVDYLGDLGFARLRAGQVAEAREPLAKAAELAPANQKAVANLALYTMLSGDGARAEAMIQKAGLSQAARDEIYRLSMSLKRASSSTTPAGGVRAAAAAPSTVDGIAAPPSMLERFGDRSDAHQENPR
ncbi:tetratricopeptide repeat protein [Pseudoxanthomonas sp. GM95]|uniref:tetratricopeptide repeat protein n=1 Tax=Pseudoxanthomonas sp. GM95 TaxID=1881043 RepID=UPI00158769AB|nr:tetratricopeptide repeat protein [Pseudoxanthomonas sp. GM95]